MGEEPPGSSRLNAGENVTEAGKIFGTPDYMAPEQKGNPAAVDHRADIYSLGVVFYQMLTGEMPGSTIPSSKIVLDIRLNEIVLRALEETPERRYARAEGMRTDLQTVAQDLAAATDPLNGRKQARRTAIELAIIVMAAAGLLAWMATSGKPDAVTPSPVTATTAEEAREESSPRHIILKAWPNHLFSLDGSELDLDGVRSALTMLWIRQLKDRKPVSASVDAAKGGEEGLAELKTAIVQSGLNSPEALIGKTPLDRGEGPVYARFKIQVEAEQYEKSEEVTNSRGEKLPVIPNIWLTEEDLISIKESKEEKGTLEVRLTPLGMRKFAYMSSRYIKRRAVILLDGKVISSPRMQVPLAPSAITLSLPDDPAARETLLHLLDGREAPASWKETLEKPPVLAAIGWQQWMTTRNGSEWLPDGTPAPVDPDRPSVSGYEVGDSRGLLRPRFLHVAFSHPFFDNGSGIALVLFDEAGKEPLDVPVAARSRGGQRGWADFTICAGADMEYPHRAVAELRYVIGPWRKGVTLDVDNSAGYSVSPGFHLGMMGKDKDGSSFIQILNSGPIGGEDVVIHFVARLVDGTVIEPKSTRMSSLNELHEARYFFDAPLENIEGFECRTRTIRKVRFPIVLKRDPHETGEFPVALDPGGREMGEVLREVARKYRVGVCFEQAQEGNRGGATGRGMVEAASLAEFLDRLTEETPYRWKRHGRRWVVTPRNGPRLDYSVRLNVANLTLAEAIRHVLDAQPGEGGARRLSLVEEGKPWESLAAPALSLDETTAADALCFITEEMLPGMIWSMRDGKLTLEPGDAVQRGILEGALTWLRVADEKKLDAFADMAHLGRGEHGEISGAVMEYYRRRQTMGNAKERLPILMDTSSSPWGKLVYKMEFRTAFENAPKTKEYVGFTEGDDGAWAPSDYSIIKEEP